MVASSVDETAPPQAHAFQTANTISNLQNIMAGTGQTVENKENIISMQNNLSDAKVVENGAVENSYDSIMN